MSKKALITGIAGQDGSYLAELLLSKGYEVHGIVRRVAIEDAEHKLLNIKHLLDRIVLHAGSLDNVLSLIKVIRDVQPDECYHLASTSFVSYPPAAAPPPPPPPAPSPHYLLAAIKEFAPRCRFYFAGSSEMFGTVDRSPQSETTPFNPRSIYGISKIAGYHLARNYRAQYGLFTSIGILYNHESPRRGYEFVTRKIVSAAVKIKLGLQDHLVLGNLDAWRDWGYAPDYVHAMWLMLQAEAPGEYVIATGETHSVQEFVEAAFSLAGLDSQLYVRTDPQLFRPSEKMRLCGDPSSARTILGWKPTMSFKDIVRTMVESEMALQGCPKG